MDLHQDLYLDLMWSYHGVLSAMVNAALDGEDVAICKDGVPVVRLVPVRPIIREDPCRNIPALAISVGPEALTPLDKEAWGEWS